MIFTPESVAALQSRLLEDLLRLAPEAVLVAAIVGLLLLRMLSPKLPLGAVALAAALLACVALAGPRLGLWPRPADGPAFTGLLHLDGFAWQLRATLAGFLLLLVAVTRLTGIPDTDDAADFYALAFGAVLGMMLMTTASHFLTVFLAVEMASLPGYVLAGFLKGRRNAGEAAMKYAVFGAAASGVMLYGISLLAVSGGAAMGGAGVVPLVGWLFVAVGVMFKLGVVPLHFWLPDVLEGAPAEVAALLATASKVGAVGLAARLLVIAPADDAVRWAMIAVAAASMTYGNLLALRQTNLKRLLAYSTIAHAGTMLMALSTRQATDSLLLYLAAYALMNLGAFATVAFVRDATGSEEVSALRGLGRRSPLVAVGFAACVASLLGLPPFAGFAGKFLVYRDTYLAGQSLLDAQPTLGAAYLTLLAVGVLNQVLSAGYYLRLLRVAFFDDAPPTPLETPERGGGLLLLVAALLVALGLVWGRL